MNTYKILDKQSYQTGSYSIVPIRHKDRFDIMKWRNEQIYHLRQQKPLSEENQNNYFQTVINRLFIEDHPEQILFSYLYNEQCIGYGGLVHINWDDQHAEISFIMDTKLEMEYFSFHWSTYLSLIEELAFEELRLHKLFTYAYDLRPQLFPVLDNMGYQKEAILKEHYFHQGIFGDVLIHSKLSSDCHLRYATLNDIERTYQWAKNPTIRQYSFSQNPITQEEHKSWFTSKIQDPQCIYYLLVQGGKQLGSIRFDIDSSASARISYLIDPCFQGKGYGKKIIQLGIDQLQQAYPTAKLVYGIVQDKNLASVKIFRDLDFEEVQEDGNNLKFSKVLIPNKNIRNQ